MVDPVPPCKFPSLHSRCSYYHGVGYSSPGSHNVCTFVRQLDKCKVSRDQVNQFRSESNGEIDANAFEKEVKSDHVVITRMRVVGYALHVHERLFINLPSDIVRNDIAVYFQLLFSLRIVPPTYLNCVKL